MRQNHLPGIELPPHPDIEEATHDYREALEAVKKANREVIAPLADVAKAKELELISRMLNAKVPKHWFALDGKRVEVEVTLPQPSVKVKVVSDDSVARPAPEPRTLEG